MSVQGYERQDCENNSGYAAGRRAGFAGRDIPEGWEESDSDYKMAFCAGHADGARSRVQAKRQSPNW